MPKDYTDEEYMRDFVDELLARTEKDLLSKKRYYSSSSFALTDTQIQWLKKFPNKSLLIRLLLEGAMITTFWDYALVCIEQIEKLERQIGKCIYEWRIAKSQDEKDEWMQAIRKGQNRRRRLIDALCKPRQLKEE